MRSLGFISLVFIVKHVGAQESGNNLCGMNIVCCLESFRSITAIFFFSFVVVSVTNDTILIQDNVDNFFVPYNDENISNVKVNNVARKANAIISGITQ
jgi:hypothetical protein